MEQSPEHPHHRTDRHCHHLWSHLVHRNDELRGWSVGRLVSFQYTPSELPHLKQRKAPFRGAFTMFGEYFLRMNK